MHSRFLSRGQLFGLLLLIVEVASPHPLTALQADSRSHWPHPLERGKYQARIASTGKVLWSVNWETRTRQKGSGTEVEVSETGEGQPWRYKEPIRWEKKMLFSEPQEASFLFDRVEGARWSSHGELLSHMEVRMDPVTHRISYRDSPAGKSTTPVSLPGTPQTLPDELLFHWARTLPFERASQEPASTQFLLLISPKQRFRVEAKVQGQEVIRTPAGTFPCYRVNLVPQLIGPLRALAPRMVLWCQADPPHYWVRYQGPIGGPGSPEAVIELVEFHSQE